jgi:hypothetical protein
MLKSTLQVYLNRLIDLSGKNRSLYLPRLVPSQMIDMKEMDQLQQKEAFYYVEAIISGKKSIPLIPFADSRDKHVNQLSQRLRRLQNLVTLAETETGEQSLYVAWPFVEGKLLNDQVIRCPLLFFPVQLLLNEGEWLLKPQEQVQPFFNKAFILAYANAYNQAPLDLEDNPLDKFPKDILEFKNELYQFLKQHFALNFNQELYESKLLTFPDVNKQIDEEKQNTGTLKLRNYAVLGQFSQKVGFLTQDYEALLAANAFENLEELFAEHFASEDHQLVDVREEQLYTVFPIDASQEAVLKAVRMGRSCVVEGPPGTGKSQLIANLAADYIARGKKVLIVSQKRAALDVVYGRLQEKGFASFLGLVHDFRTDRRELFKKLLDQINSLDNYQKLNSSIDAIQLERQFLLLSRQIDNQVEYLDEFKKALYNTEECGLPIKALYLSTDDEVESLDLTQYYRRFHWNSVDTFLRNFKLYASYYQTYQHPGSFWLHRVDFGNFGIGAANRLQEVLSEVEGLKHDFVQRYAKYEGFDVSFLFSFYEQHEKLKQLKSHLHLPESLAVFSKIKHVDPAQIDLLWLEHKIDALKSLFSEEGIAWQVEDEEVEPCFQLAINFAARKKSIYNSLTWPFQKKAYQQLMELLKQNHLSEDASGNAVLIKRLENRLNLNHQYTLLSGKEWLDLPAKPFDFVAINHFGSIHLDAVKAIKLLESMGELGGFLLKLMAEESVPKALDRLIDFVEMLESHMGFWNLYLSKIQVQHLITQNIEGGIVSLREQVPFVYDELVDFDNLRRRSSPEDLAVMDKILELFPEKDFDSLKAIFLQSLRSHWIEHIETKYPVLKDATSLRLLDTQRELMDAVEEKWELSNAIAELRCRELTFKNLEYNRLNNLLTYRDLKHQVSKQKKIWSIRQVMEAYAEEVFRLIPCWLASPETVSAIFPMQQLFDLVIFDEASQCYVERGIPAMLRGQQVVIAGDSQQLQPYDLYQTRVDSEDEGLELETESLLDLATGFFPKYWLQGHYRSAQLPLIHFSNMHFYENKLGMLPELRLLNQAENPFELVQVAGVWENQTNLQEAEMVLEVLDRILTTEPDFRVGVITFNFYQMELISQLLQERKHMAYHKVAVKNIENVQGDEFDWVVFSIGYAKNKKGKLIANFGLLSKMGGQNRLNVAITRARRKITLITSLHPTDFKKEQLSNPGIKLLHDYLGFVEDMVSGKPIEVIPVQQGYESNFALKNFLVGKDQQYSVNTYPESPVLDLTVSTDSEVVEALLTDDERLYVSGGPKEPFVYHPILLRSKGWPYRFFFSRQFWKERSS